MNELKIKVIQELASDFDQKNFDLEAWKIKASLVLKRIFGEKDEKVGLIQNLHYDFSSWSLRDHSGGKQHDPVKDQAREIIETAILELKLIDDLPAVTTVMQSVLSGSEFVQLQQLRENKLSNEMGLTEYFSKIAPEKKDLILAQIILKLSE